MDISDTLIAKSDQINADDLTGGPITVTVDRVKRGEGEQPIDIIVTEFPGKAFRPCKTMRRVLAAAWGVDATRWAGRQMTLYRDPEALFGGVKVGGIRISHVSHIDAPMHVTLNVSRGKKATWPIAPLAGQTPAVLPEGIDAAKLDLYLLDLGRPKWTDADEGQRRKLVTWLGQPANAEKVNSYAPPRQPGEEG
jgi:hypothetical protein